MNKIKQAAIALVMVFGIGLFVAPAATVGAVNVDPLQGACANNSTSAVCKSADDDVSTIVTTVINVLLFVVGVLSVIMIIVGGIMYTVSAGDAGAVTKAKNTILYSIIGLVVAFLAYAIVNWVILRFV